VNVYGKNGEWKVVKAQLCHNHMKFVGFQGASDAEGTGVLAAKKEMRNHDIDLNKLQLLVKAQLFPAHAGSEKNITAQAICSFLQQHGHKVSKQTAGRLKKQVLDKNELSITDSYQQLESYLSSVAANNPGSVWSIEKAADGTFLCACFLPSACLQVRAHCLKIVGLDGTHLKGEMNKQGCILTATTKDYDHHILVFGFAIVSIENYDNWQWFLKQLQVAKVGACEDASEELEDKPLFISDHQKGLLAAVESVYPNCGHRFCLYHIIGNISKLSQRLTPVEEGYMYDMAHADCENDWKAAFSEFKAL